MKNTFVNAAIFYEFLGKSFDNLDTESFMVLSIAERLSNEKYLPESIRKDMEYIKRHLEEIRRQIKNIDNEFKGMKGKAPGKAAIYQQYVDGSKRLERITVFKGGLYKPPIRNNGNNILSDFFLAWRERQKPEARV